MPAADISGQQTTIGIFNTAEEAAQAYDAAAMSMYGLSASLNFPAQVSSPWGWMSYLTWALPWVGCHAVDRGWMSHLMLALPGQAVVLLILPTPPLPC